MISQSVYGTLPMGEETHVFELSAAGVAVRVCDFGATVLGIDVPDAAGEVADIVLGFAGIEGYAGENGAFYGATAGPVANRTARGEVPIEGAVYQLPINDNGANNLHTDKERGLHKRVWKVEGASGEPEGGAHLELSCPLADGEFGLPGNRVATAVYELSAEGVLTVTYRMETDAATYANITNHTYFNLAGHTAGCIEGQLLQLDAERYVPIDATSIPEGRLDPVEGTPFDFRELHAIGRDIACGDVQIVRGAGYDHCFCVDGYEPDGPARHAAHAEDPASGRAMDISISAPGIQLYTGNWLEDPDAKAGAGYSRRHGFALEPEFYPDAVHHGDWPQPVCTPEHPFESVIEYRFSTAG